MIERAFRIVGERSDALGVRLNPGGCRRAAASGKRYGRAR